MSYVFTYAIVDDRHGNSLRVTAPNATQARRELRHIIRLLRLCRLRLLKKESE